MKNRWIILVIGCVLAACSKNTVNFGYSPTKPKAGEKVQFTNLSTSGEEWEWTFGDGGTSEVKNPSKIYKQPGTYTVMLKVDSKASLVKTASITVYDTVPTFSCSVEGADTAGINVFEDVTFTALVYNPYNYTVEYEWSVQSNVLYKQLSETNTESTFKLYFEQAGTNAGGVSLRVTLNGITRDTLRVFKVNDVKTTSVVMMTSDSSYLRQRVFGARAEMPYPMAKEDSVGRKIVNAAQDTVQEYNGKTFTLKELQKTFPAMTGFSIASRKIYFRQADGLFVANIDGTFKEPIASGKILTQGVDVVNNRVYWSVPDSVMYMPLIGTENNKFTTQPTTLNRTANIVKLAIDSEKR